MKLKRLILTVACAALFAVIVGCGNRSRCCSSSSMAPPPPPIVSYAPPACPTGACP